MTTEVKTLMGGVSRSSHTPNGLHYTIPYSAIETNGAHAIGNYGYTTVGSYTFSSSIAANQYKFVPFKRIPSSMLNAQKTNSSALLLTYNPSTVSGVKVHPAAYDTINTTERMTVGGFLYGNSTPFTTPASLGYGVSFQMATPPRWGHHGDAGLVIWNDTLLGVGQGFQFDFELYGVPGLEFDLDNIVSLTTLLG